MPSFRTSRPLASAHTLSCVPVAMLGALLLLAGACVTDTPPEPQNPGGVGDGLAGAAGAAGGAGAGDAGAAGTTSDATLPDLAGCTFDAAVDGTDGPQEVTIPDGQFAYSPACLKVKVGAVVTFTGGSGLHPLAPMTKATSATSGNPIPSSTEASIPVTFEAPGAFPYFCTNHGTDGGTSGMVGAVYVVP